MVLLIKLLKSIQNTGSQQSGSSNLSQLKNYKRTLVRLEEYKNMWILPPYFCQFTYETLRLPVCSPGPLPNCCLTFKRKDLVYDKSG